MEAALDTGPHSPVVDGYIATFWYEDRAARSVSLICESAEWQPLPFEQREGLWWLNRSYPEDARDEYQLAVDGEVILDPANPHMGPGGFGPRSECRMPEYVPPRPFEPVVDGRFGPRLIAGREVGLYVPEAVEGANLLVVQDGADYVQFGGMPGLIDALIREGSIEPAVAVFVSPLDREREYRPNDTYLSWVADELVKGLSDQLPIHPGPDHHAMIGASLGGLIATYGALARPEVFGLVGAQSPAFRVAPYLLEPEYLRNVREQRFHVDGGLFETHMYRKPYLPFIRVGADLIRDAGAAVQYTEVNEGHNWTSWRGRLPRLLRFLIGA